MRLYVAADGPRVDRAGEADRCAEVRRIATAVDWPCELRTLFHTKNLGCRGAVSGAITWFFEHEPEGIVLEDDCLPHPDFFPWCAAMLERYRDERRVMCVTGNELPVRHGRLAAQLLLLYLQPHLGLGELATSLGALRRQP